MIQIACQILVVVRNGTAFFAHDLATEEILCWLGCEKGNEIDAGVSLLIVQLKMVGTVFDFRCRGASRGIALRQRHGTTHGRTPRWMKTNVPSRLRCAHDFNNHVTQGDRASGCQRRCLMKDNNVQFGTQSLHVRSMTCQAHPHGPLGLGDLGASSLRHQEQLRQARYSRMCATFRTQWQRGKLFIRACSFFELLSMTFFLQLVGNAIGCSSVQLEADRVCLSPQETVFHDLLLSRVSPTLQHSRYMKPEIGQNAFRSSCRGQCFTRCGGSSTPVVTSSANQGPRYKLDGGSSVAGANEEGIVEVKMQASRGLVKETSWERQEDDATQRETCPPRGYLSAWQQVAVEVNTQIFLSWTTISNFP